MASRLRAFPLAGLLGIISLAATAQEEGFVVRDMRIIGLQRISEGTVFNYLPVNIGDRLDRGRIQEATRALYNTGFFNDVELRRDDGTLIIAVLERPSIENFSISGNKDIKTEDLQSSLRSAGLAAGKTFKPSVLDEVERALNDQYYSHGKYGVQIKSNVEELPGNKVNISIEIKEGERSRIRQINIVGNESFTDQEIIDDFTLHTPNWLSWYRQDDRYAEEALRTDLETLRSFYMDRGHADFDILSTQVTISPDKKDIFITINVEEGERYTISDIKVAGTEVMPTAELEALVLAKPGQTFNRRLLTQTGELISYRLGAAGYAFARVDPIPELDKEKKEVKVTFFIDPGNRVYVRRVNFRGTTSINDEVLRREMRQMEGGFLNNAAVDRSKVRLQRLPYIEQVEVETNEVAGTPDLVDVDFTIKEGLPGQFGGGIGYSDSQKLILNGNFVHSNFLGTGKRIGLDINSSRFATVYSFSHTDPYRTIDGLSRTASITYRDITQFTSASTDFSTETLTGALEYGYPISEYQRLRFGIALQDSNLVTNSFGSLQAQDWVRRNGNSRTEFVNTDPDDPTIGFSVFSTQFFAYELVLGWSYDSRNRAFFATRGMRQGITLTSTIPGSEIEFFTATYDFLKLFPITRRWVFAINAEFAYGQDFGDSSALPPYRNFYAGGPDTVRGYRENRLGPKDSFGNPYGGNLRVVGQAELLLPLPERWQNAARLSLFYDIGNVFSTGHVNFVDQDGDPIDYGFDVKELKQSTGIAVQWLAPLGLFRFSYAFPLNQNKGRGVFLDDDTESFQFSVGSAF